MNNKKLENVKMSDKNKRLKKKTENNDNGNGEKDESWYYVQLTSSDLILQINVGRLFHGYTAA